MAFGVKTNERPGTRAQVRYLRMSAYKAREVLDLIRGKEVQQAQEILQLAERDAAIVIKKCLESAMANAEQNDQIDSEELFVSACFADEGPTLKRWRPRARGRATRIRKRTCHITIIVTRLSEEQLERRRVRESASPTAAGRGRRRSQAAAQARAERVRRSRTRDEAVDEHDEHDHDHEHDELGEVDDITENAETITPSPADREPAEGGDAEVDADADVEAEAEATEDADVDTTEAETPAADDDADDAKKDEK
jgi:large subunit ribosomal protein L22